jgi:integrase
LDHTEADRLAPFWKLALNTGARRGELLGLAWDDLDFEAATVAIRRALVTVGYATMIRPTKTDWPRLIDLDAGMLSVLRDWRRHQLEERLRWGSAWRDEGWIFTNEDGSRLHPDEVSKRFNRLVSSAGVRRIRLHDVRHTWACTALKAGVHPKVVSERLGHSSIAITLDTYSHVMPGMGREAGELVASVYLSGGASQ